MTEPTRPKKRSSTISSVAHGVQSVASEILNSDPPPGFFAATAGVAARAPTIQDIRRGSFDAEQGWHADAPATKRRRTLSQSSQRRSRRISGEDQERVDSDEVERGGLEAFPTLAEEPSHLSRDDERPEAVESVAHIPPAKGHDDVHTTIVSDAGDGLTHIARTDHDRIQHIAKDRRVYSSGYIPPPVVPWTTSTATALRAFLKWFFTPFGFLLTVYGLNVVAWGGMLFLLLCNASSAMCWAPIPNADTRLHHSPAASLALNSKYPRYYNCNDINSPRRVWLEIDSQILNALFCVTGFGLVPWRFRDLWYILRYRMTSEKKYGREKKMYGLRVLAGIYNGWIRLPGSQTLDQLSRTEYELSLSKDNSPAISTSSTRTDLEAGEDDLRIPLPASTHPSNPLTGVRAPATAIWKIEFFVWSMVLNTLLQCCLCGFMWGMTRYNRPSWATGLFIALACIIAGAGGWVSFVEGKKVRRVEGVAASSGEGGDASSENAQALEQTRTQQTGHESVYVGEDEKGKK